MVLRVPRIGLHAGFPASVLLPCKLCGHAAGGAGRVTLDSGYAVGHRPGARAAGALAGVARSACRRPTWWSREHRCWRTRHRQGRSPSRAWSPLACRCRERAQPRCWLRHGLGLRGHRGLCRCGLGRGLRGHGGRGNCRLRCACADNSGFTAGLVVALAAAAFVVAFGAGAAGVAALGAGAAAVPVAAGAAWADSPLSAVSGADAPTPVGARLHPVRDSAPTVSTVASFLVEQKNPSGA